MVSYQKCSDGGQLSPWRDVRAVEGTGLENRRRASVRGFESHSLRHFFKFICYLQKYPRGRRGSPAKGVGWIKPARGFKSLLPRQMKNRWNCLQYLQFQRFFAVFNCPLEPDKTGYKGMREHSPEHSRLYSPAFTMPW